MLKCLDHFGESVPPEEDVDAVDVAAVQSDWVGTLCGCVLETEEIVGHLRWAGHLTGTVQTQHQQVHHQAVVLYNERGKLEPPDDAVGVGVVHILDGQKTKRLTYRSNTSKNLSSETVTQVRLYAERDITYMRGLSSYL